MKSWRTQSSDLKSKGSRIRPDGLAGLADARDQHRGQFWTPAPLVQSLWSFVSPYLNAIHHSGRKAVLLDNSFGSGALWQGADSGKHILMGSEIDKSAFDLVTGDADAGGFETVLRNESMEDLRFCGADLALINPPFSLTFSGPQLSRFATNSYGKYGPRTQARSHLFAISQALEAAPVVVAIVPGGFIGEALHIESWAPRLHRAYTLPHGVFAGEGVDYPTAILVFGPAGTAAHATIEPWDLTNPPKWPLSGAVELQTVEPAVLEQVRERRIKAPITGDNRVQIGHNGRKLSLTFYCGQMEAQVLKELYGERIRYTKSYRAARDKDKMRLPRGFGYVGDALFDLETYLLQPDPVKALYGLARRIGQMGAAVQFAPGFLARIKKLIKKRRREGIPFGRTVFEDVKRATLTDGLAAGEFRGICRMPFLCDPDSWSAPAVRPGVTIAFRKQQDERVSFEFKGKNYSCALPHVHEHFDIETVEQESADRWRTIYDGKAPHCRSQIANEAARAKSLGIDQWLWAYQWEDLLELRAVEGAVLGYEMGLGKARMAIALCLLGGNRNLIVVEAHLIDEMIEELQKVGVQRDLWQVIRNPRQLTHLKRINLIAYSRLRKPLVAGCRRTYAACLRRRISTVVADEAHCLRNRSSQQSRALQTICARRRYALTGTPIANYPRDLLPLIVWTAGEATAAQPYGYHRPFMEPGLIHSARYAVRGVDQFRKDFVTMEWCTNEFADEMEKGAKREIPKIANLPRYREFASRYIKRRVRAEPAVRRYIDLPAQSETVHTVAWDAGHFSFYRDVSEKFAEWYRQQHRTEGRNVNLIALLRRIEAVVSAANLPSKAQDGFGAYCIQTSKERAIVAQLERFAAAGHRTIVFARSPALLDRLQRFCEQRGIRSGMCHGQIPQRQRSRTLTAFKNYELPVLFGSFGVTQSGLNLYQADRVIFAQRDWTAKTENQAKARVLRPQQKSEVEFHFFHLKGSIDEYQAQMVGHKNDSACAGLDFAEPEFEGEEFLHLDTILGRFVNALKEHTPTLAA